MDQFEVLDLIGKGSFGSVFKARRRQDGHLVALKLIPKVGHSERELVSLRQECKIQAELRHPNVVRMFDAFETTKEVVAVTEFVQGDLHDLMLAVRRSHGAFDEASMRSVAADLVSALHYLHSHRILHRDIKPQNILITESNTAKLCDFGFARNLGLNTYVLTSIKGTPLYMAPELIEEKPYDHNADLWSVGCILYELVAGVPPFHTNSLFKLIEKIRYESIRWPGNLSDVCLDFLKGLLEKDCKRRLTWPALLEHPFVRDRVSVLQEGQGKVPLTAVLSESQELAKEIQRQDKAQSLPGGSQTLIKVAQKHEERRKQLESVARQTQSMAMMPAPLNAGQMRRHSDLAGYHHPMMAHFESRRGSDMTSAFRAINTAQYLSPPAPIRPAFVPPNLPKPLPIKPIPPANIDVQAPAAAVQTNETDSVNDCYADGVLTLKHSAESEEDKTIENEEWCLFLDNQLEEAMQEVSSLRNQNFVNMIIAPLRNSKTSSMVIEKISALLMFPLVGQSAESVTELLDIYFEVKVLANLVFACNQLSSDENVEPSVLEHLVKLLVRLIHEDDRFVVQFCDSVCVLKASKGFAKLIAESQSMTADLLSILCRVVVRYSEGVCIAKDILDSSDVFGRPLRTLPTKRLVKTLILLGLLARGEPKYLKSKLDNFNVFQDFANSSLEPDVVKAKNFALQWMQNTQV